MVQMKDMILFHRTPADEWRTQIIKTITEATYNDDADDFNDLIGHVAHVHNMTSRDVLEILGIDFKFGDPEATPDGDVEFTMQVVPDGIRACYRSECPHGPGYIAA
jgi:hypothetical protein